MQKTQYLLLVAALVVIVGLSFLPKTVVKNPDKALQTENKQPTIEKDATAAPDSATQTQPNLQTMHQAELTADQRKQVAALQQKMDKANTEKDKTVWLDSLVSLLQSANQYDSAAYFAENFAKNYANVGNFVRTGDAYYGALQFTMDEKKAQNVGEKARQYFQKALDQNPNLSEVKIKLGLTYVASPTPMQGILLIREVLKEEPENIFALMSLGKLSIQSGQFDKAIGRFQQILGLQADNAEAKFLLAYSLGESGKKTEAIKLLEELKKQSKDPAVLMQTDGYLKQLEGK